MEVQRPHKITSKDFLGKRIIGGQEPRIKPALMHYISISTAYLDASNSPLQISVRAR